RLSCVTNRPLPAQITISDCRTWRPPLAERISGGNLNGPATEGPDEVLAVQRRSQRAGGEDVDRLNVGRLIACCSGQHRYSGELPRPEREMWIVRQGSTAVGKSRELPEDFHEAGGGKPAQAVQCGGRGVAAQFGGGLLSAGGQALRPCPGRDVGQAGRQQVGRDVPGAEGALHDGAVEEARRLRR